MSLVPGFLVKPPPGGGGRGEVEKFYPTEFCFSRIVGSFRFFLALHESSGTREEGGTRVLLVRGFFHS